MNWSACVVELETDAGREGHILLSVEPPADAPRRPLVINLLLDRSGSMRGAPLSAAVEAALQLVDQADADDFLGLLAFDQVAEQRVPLIPMDARGKARMRDAFGSLEAGHGTALHQAIEAGAAALARVLAPGRSAKILLLTDGEPSIGPETEDQFASLGQKIAAAGASVHALGLGAHYVPEILEALTAPCGNGYEHVDGPDGLPVTLGALFALLFGEVASGVAVRVTPVGFRALQCRHAYPTRAEGDSLRVEMGAMSRGLIRRVLLSGPLAGPEWSVTAQGEFPEHGDTRMVSVPVNRVWPDSPEGQGIRAAGIELELVTAETQAWMALARKELDRAEGLLDTASVLLQQLVALEQDLALARRHMERVGELRASIDSGARDVPLMVRRARSQRAGTHVSQVIPISSRRPKG
jgi:Ca-activated chloride channel family protein